MGKQVQELISINGRYKIRQGEVKNSMGNGEAKKLNVGMSWGRH